MKLERRKFHYQGYYNSNQGYPVPCECVLEYVEPIEAEALEKRVEELEKENKALFENNKELYAAGLAMKVENKRLRAALQDIADKYYCQCIPASPIDSEGAYLCNRCIARRALEAKG